MQDASGPAGLPDLRLEPGLRLVFVGYNPSLPAARCGHYYAGRQNFFYRLLYQSGLTPHLFAPEEDETLPNYGIGLTDLCSVPTAQAAQLPRGALRTGRRSLTEKLLEHRPEMVCFNGLGVYRSYFGYPAILSGPQRERIGESRVWVVPSTSPANNGLMREREAAFVALAKAFSALGSTRAGDVGDHTPVGAALYCTS